MTRSPPRLPRPTSPHRSFRTLPVPSTERSRGQVECRKERSNPLSTFDLTPTPTHERTYAIAPPCHQVKVGGDLAAAASAKSQAPVFDASSRRACVKARSSSSTRSRMTRSTQVCRLRERCNRARNAARCARPAGSPIAACVRDTHLGDSHAESSSACAIARSSISSCVNWLARVTTGVVRLPRVDAGASLVFFTMANR